MPSTADRTQPTPREIYYAVRRLLPLLPAEERQAIIELLKRGQKGEAVETTLLRRLKPFSRIRKWLSQALYTPPEAGARTHTMLPGTIGEIPARSLWCCPKCDFSWRVLRKGRPVPPCPKDGSPLERSLTGKCHDG